MVHDYITALLKLEFTALGQVHKIWRVIYNIAEGNKCINPNDISFNQVNVYFSAIGCRVAKTLETLSHHDGDGVLP